MVTKVCAVKKCFVLTVKRRGDWLMSWKLVYSCAVPLRKYMNPNFTSKQLTTKLIPDLKISGINQTHWFNEIRVRRHVCSFLACLILICRQHNSGQKAHVDCNVTFATSYSWLNGMSHNHNTATTITAKELKAPATHVSSLCSVRSSTAIKSLRISANTHWLWTKQSLVHLATKFNQEILSCSGHVCLVIWNG